MFKNSCFRKRAVTETFLSLNSSSCFNVLSKSVLPHHVELKPSEFFMWSHPFKLKFLYWYASRLKTENTLLSFLGKFGPKIRNCYFKLKFRLTWICRTQMVIFIFSALDRRYRFRANLVQKIKIILTWNFIRRLISICRIQGDAHFFCFRLEITFLGKFNPKNKNCYSNQKLVLRLNWIYRI